MSLKVIKTDKFSFIVDEVKDELRDKMGIVFGREVRLYAKRVHTQAKPKGVYQYPDYFSSQPVQVCKIDEVIEQRPLNNNEYDIYRKLSSGGSVDKIDKKYLRNNYLES